MQSAKRNLAWLNCKVVPDFSHLVAGTTWRSHGVAEDGCCSWKVSIHGNTAFISKMLLQCSLYWKWCIRVWMVSRWMVLLQQTELWHQVRHHEEADELYQVAPDTHRWARRFLFYPLFLTNIVSAFFGSAYFVSDYQVMWMLEVSLSILYSF